MVRVNDGVKYIATNVLIYAEALIYIDKRLWVVAVSFVQVVKTLSRLAVVFLRFSTCWSSLAETDTYMEGDLEGLVTCCTRSRSAGIVYRSRAAPIRL